MSTDLTTWALPRLARLLPIDEQSLSEILSYTISLSKEAGAEHLKNLLGDSNQALDFISTFNSRRPNVTTQKPQTSRSFNNTPEHTDSDAAAPRRKSGKKAKAPLHNAGPVRKPEGYGVVTGGYQKKYEDDDFLGGTSRQTSSAISLSSALAISKEPAILQIPKVTLNATGSSPGSSRDASPAPGRGRLPPSAAGSLISDLPNVRSKQSKKPTHSPHSSVSTPRSGGPATTTTSSITDLTAAIAALEVATNPTHSSEPRKCDCNASIHPLFESAPNCVSCGKIICVLEGLQPCSFCGSPVLSKEQINSMIKALKEERGVERMATHNAGVASGRGTPMLGGSTPDSSGDESSSAAARARAHRDKLLAFQRENAQRTRVYDEAADYDITLTPGATQWMSPVQRAAALKKQQKYLREVQEANRPEWEKKRTVMSVSIKNGKLVKTFERQNAPPLMADTVDDHEEDKLDPETSQNLSSGKQGAFSNNPLLAGGKLVRPIWKGKGTEDGVDNDSTRARKSVWRKVQDDNEDNEQWILDGGLRGYGTETRLMEDGSQQECG